MDLRRFIEEFQDYLAPKLDTYEQAVYLYVFRHSRLLGLDEVTIGFKSARKKMAFGIGKKGTPVSEHVIYEKLRSLMQKGCLEILETERTGTRVRVRLPSEMPGVLPAAAPSTTPTLDEIDFFESPEGRQAILQREEWRCFYCLRKLTQDNYVIDHVVSRPAGDSSYRNVVAACRGCNNRKGATKAEDFLRDLYRNGYLSEGDLEKRFTLLQRLQRGELRPKLEG